MPVQIIGLSDGGDPLTIDETTRKKRETATPQPAQSHPEQEKPRSDSPRPKRAESGGSAGRKAKTGQGGTPPDPQKAESDSAPPADIPKAPANMVLA